MEIYVTHTNAGLSLIREKTGIEATKITGEFADYTKTRTKRRRKQNYMQYIKTVRTQTDESSFKILKSRW